MEIYSLIEWQKTRQALQVNSHNKGQMIEDITNTSSVNASRRLVILFSRRKALVANILSVTFRILAYMKGVDGRSVGRMYVRSYGDVITKISGIDELSYCLTNGVPRARSEGARGAPLLIQHGDHTPADHLVYSGHLWYWTSMLWSIDTCQKSIHWPVSRDHIAGSNWELIEGSCFFSWPLTSYWFPIGSQAQARPKRGFILRALSCGSTRLPLRQVNIFTVDACRV